jgi:hypothetical protein
MPQYRMVNPETGEAEDISCKIADMEALKTQGWTHIFVPNPNSIISGRDMSGHGGGHGTDEGWKDTLRRIRDNNPHSTIDV